MHKKWEEGGLVVRCETKKQVGGETKKAAVSIARLGAYLLGAAFPGLPGQAAEG